MPIFGISRSLPLVISASLKHIVDIFPKTKKDLVVLSRQ